MDGRSCLPALPTKDFAASVQCTAGSAASKVIIARIRKLRPREVAMEERKARTSCGTCRKHADQRLLLHRPALFLKSRKHFGLDNRIHPNPGATDQRNSDLPCQPPVCRFTLHHSHILCYILQVTFTWIIIIARQARYQVRASVAIYGSNLAGPCILSRFVICFGALLLGCALPKWQMGVTHFTSDSGGVRIPSQGSCKTSWKR